MKINKLLTNHINETAAKKTFPYSPGQLVAEVREVLGKDDDIHQIRDGEGEEACERKPYG